VYDPGSANGRLLLGLKGTISEVELHTLRGRLTAGLHSKAERGELALLLPAGLERDGSGVVLKSQSQEVQQRLSLVFTMFLELGSVGKVIRSLHDRALTVPRRDRFRDIIWRSPTSSNVAGILKNPAYAGAFVYGRTRSCQTTYASGKLITRRCPMLEWKILVKDRYPAYLDWESFERVQAMLRDNHAEYQRNKTRGVPREGAAVLQGIAWCGLCGHKMAVEYKNANRYVCNFFQRSQAGSLCQHLPADPIDARVVEAFLAAVGPAELEAWSRAQDTKQQAREALERAEVQQVERLRYQALLAERQYNRVDPDNRLIAAELERRWEGALRELQQAEDTLARHRAVAHESDALTSDERENFLTLGPQLPLWWERSDVNREHKKALLRCLIEKVVLMRTPRDTISIRVVWQGGEISELEVERRVHATSALSRGAEMEARIVELAHQGMDDIEIANTLTEEGHRSPRSCKHVRPRTVQVVRQRHRVLQSSTATRARHIAGWLTIDDVAEHLQVSRSWIKRRIHSGIIEIHRDPTDKRFLFPDTPGGIDALRELRAGTRDHLVVDPRPNK
jgi:hypothetical protein